MKLLLKHRYLVLLVMLTGIVVSCGARPAFIVHPDHARQRLAPVREKHRNTAQWHFPEGLQQQQLRIPAPVLHNGGDHGPTGGLSHTLAQATAIFFLRQATSSSLNLRMRALLHRLSAVQRLGLYPKHSFW